MTTSSAEDDSTAVAALRDEVTHLRRKISTLSIIEQAKGVLMLRYGIDSPLAFGLLTRWSQSLELRVGIVAALLLELAGVGQPPANPPALLRALEAEMGGPWRSGDAREPGQGR